MKQACTPTHPSDKTVSSAHIYTHLTASAFLFVFLFQKFSHCWFKIMINAALFTVHEASEVWRKPEFLEHASAAWTVGTSSNCLTTRPCWVSVDVHLHIEQLHLSVERDSTSMRDLSYKPYWCWGVSLWVDRFRFTYITVHLTYLWCSNWSHLVLKQIHL